MLYDSLHQKLLTLPDDVEVFPAHAAGPLRAEHLEGDVVHHREQRRFNYALQT